MGSPIRWPKQPTTWVENRTLHVSIPFTWHLAQVRDMLAQGSPEWDTAIIGGPAADLHYQTFAGMKHVEVRHDHPGALQRVHPMATRTTLGCPNHCPFCAVPRTAGPFRELHDWPDLPILIDDNLLAASQVHLDRVFDRLEQWDRPPDFAQGLDARRLNVYHAHRLARLARPVIRLALDDQALKGAWDRAYRHLRKAGIVKKQVRSYVLVAFNTGPDECWDRCQFVESYGAKALPMWYTPLDAQKPNQVTAEQEALGWNDYERRRIMQWYYQHKRAVK